MTSRYTKLGFPVLFPENWEITEEQTEGSPRSLSLQSPSGAVWILQIFPSSSPRELTEQALNTMRAEYESVEAEPILEVLEGHELVGFDMNFYCLDFLVGAQAVSFHHRHETLVVFTQAESRDYEELAPVFRAMLIGILRG
ncbi:MAG: hypothetical protein ACKOBW_17400 [Planctomycetota bacterium]